MYTQFLFLRTFFKVKVLSKLEAFGIFCAEDGVRTFPRIEPIGMADWWNPAKAFGDVGPVGKNPTLEEDDPYVYGDIWICTVRRAWRGQVVVCVCVSVCAWAVWIRNGDLAGMSVVAVGLWGWRSEGTLVLLCPRRAGE